ncbi:MAG: type II secretion system protein [Thermoanaerobaculales bacterium]|jgi:prepilin-type N-terminal cleavage/methylation domain-containing protein|nr:type II secretion system protein [Thermoanaerobaculales bacterium]
MSAPARNRGFTLVEALAALAITAMAVLVATAFLQAHVNAARRVEVRSALVAEAERALEEIRAGLRPMTPAVFDPASGAGSPMAGGVQVSVNVLPGGAPDLYRVTVVSRSSASVTEPMEVVLDSMVWRP